MYNLIEYNNNCAKISGRVYQYCKDDPNSNMTDSESFKFNSRLTNICSNAGIENVEIAVPIKYLSIVAH